MCRYPWLYRYHLVRPMRINGWLSRPMNARDLRHCWCLSQSLEVSHG